jgi:hypothetical protein
MSRREPKFDWTYQAITKNTGWLEERLNDEKLGCEAKVRKVLGGRN